MAQYGQFEGVGLPQIAVAGKSNVGKSSLINKLCNRRSLARTSQTPGKTRLINAFLLNDSFHLIDLLIQCIFQCHISIFRSINIFILTGITGRNNGIGTTLE